MQYISQLSAAVQGVMIRTLVLFASLLVSSVTRGSDGDTCHLPSGDPAVCVDISRCSHLTKLISNLQKPFPGDVSLLIRDSFLCSASATAVSVCCPLDGLDSPLENPPQVESRDTCQMQRSEPAQCVTYNKCSPFVQLLVNIKKPLDPVVPRMVRSSFLCGVDETTGTILPQICCPSAALGVTTAPPTTTTQPPSPVDKYNSHPGRKFIADNSNCGRAAPNMRIVGGEDSSIGQFPWLVNLGYQANGQGDKLFKCGGTLIGPQHIVTAAHCVTGLPKGFVLTTIRVGEHDLDSDIDCDESGVCAPPPQDIEVDRVILHPSYSKPEVFQNDIALVKLARNVTESEYVSPICLPWADDNENYIDGARSGAEAAITEVAGWGATTPTGRKPANVLQFLDVSVTDSDDCKDIYKERGGILGSSQICAGGVKGKVSKVYFPTLKVSKVNEVIQFRIPVLETAVVDLCEVSLTIQMPGLETDGT